ncbi:PREDICTED: uncharacterized protein LOC108613873 [Drosophila arizonae]|uniref:Phospholipid scramblase n=1 Tax=Drosophila arizonae TaxID=7263 RepID=A0ABM1P7E4_DROAR|nr:PREDICTED: uncharacterized protein LOC108613873 [Drosophila arizonae]
MEMKEVPKAIGEMPSSSRKGDKDKKETEEKRKKDEVWMVAPSDSRVTRGLEVLSSLDKIYVSQRLMPFEEYTSKKFMFQIKNGKGENVYRGLERPSVLQFIFDSSYPFKMDLVDKSGTKLVELDHPCSCALCPCFNVCDKKIKVYAPPGHYIGQVLKIISYKYTEYVVQDANGKEVIFIDGPPFYKNITKVTLAIWDSHDHQIGTITKEFPVLESLFTESSYFSASFPSSLNTNYKALILGGVILLSIASI